MAYALSLLKRFGIFSRKTDTTDTTEVFAHRLTRIGSRDARREVRATVFLRTPM